MINIYKICLIRSYVQIILVYLLIGTIIGFIMESMIRYTQQEVNKYERFSLITFWPFMILIFTYYFIVGLFNSDD